MKKKGFSFLLNRKSVIKCLSAIGEGYRGGILKGVKQTYSLKVSVSRNLNSKAKRKRNFPAEWEQHKTGEKINNNNNFIYTYIYSVTKIYINRRTEK